MSKRSSATSFVRARCRSFRSDQRLASGIALAKSLVRRGWVVSVRVDERVSGEREGEEEAVEREGR